MKDKEGNRKEIQIGYSACVCVCVCKGTGQLDKGEMAVHRGG